MSSFTHSGRGEIMLEPQEQGKIVNAAIQSMDFVSGQAQASIATARDLIVEKIRYFVGVVQDRVVLETRVTGEHLRDNITRLRRDIEIHTKELTAVTRSAIEAEARARIADSMLLRPSLRIIDGQWEASYGEDGPWGRGDSPRAAFADFDKAWRRALPQADSTTAA